MLPRSQFKEPLFGASGRAAALRSKVANARGCAFIGREPCPSAVRDFEACVALPDPEAITSRCATTLHLEVEALRCKSWLEPVPT
jgi:hypothetical protein